MQKLTIKRFMYTYFFICITLIGSFSIFLDLDFINKQGIVIVSFLINGVIILFELSKSSKVGYSLKDIFYLFLFIFMFISPLIQYLKGVFPWWNTYLLTDEKIIYTNLIILLFLLVYLTIYKIAFKNRIIIKNREVKNIRLVMDIFFVATVFCSLFIIINTGFSNLFARVNNSLQVELSSFALIISNTFRSVSVIYVGMNLLFILKNKYVYRIIPFMLGSILMILVNFPTATARFWMASVYLGLLIILINKLKNPHIFKIIIFIGILVIFPAINTFRNNSFVEVIRNGINIAKPADAFLAGDFDSFSMLVRTIIYADSYGVTWGNQLLGNLLFFIPRSFWPTKPIGSGSMIAEDFGWNFTNVSLPFIGEGFINFGILGVVLFAVILAMLCKFGDSKYEKCIYSENRNITFIELIFPFSIGFLFFILRGDLLSSLSYYIGFMAPVIILWLIQSLKIRS
ncbi:O-antigen polymerase [Cytobacillus sp. FJAT-53684]|uniref:O-antigen polymerase n=1 Tax=Cytobacillus mangrovibacter TaxID=3299024 RepID=A0ABW6K1U4_9BACI